MVLCRALLLLLCSILPAEALLGRCGHAEKQRSDVPSRNLQRAPSTSYMSAYSRGGPWEPIRISVYYGPLNITESLRDKLYGALRGSINWFQHTLKVRPVLKPWSLGYPTCLDTFFTGPITTAEFDSDYIVYVIADMENNGMAGYSTFCQVDIDTGQPIVGLYYFNGLVHERASDEQIFSTTVHELTHAMVFSGDLYPYYTKPSGELYSENEFFVQEMERGYVVLKIALPTVTAKAREAFNCSSLNGVELEGGGGPGSFGVHWEKRLMYNDYMVADTDIYDIVYTEISVALFQDSGWYQVSYKYTNPVQWGFHQGCEFISKRCVEDGRPLTPDFCTESKSENCDFMHLRKGFCDLMVHSFPLPWEYQYFNRTDIGGSDWYLDLCPVIKPYSNGDCRSPGTVKLRQGFDEQPGLSSKCFMWNERVQNDTLASLSACYPLNCDRAAVLTVGKQEIVCPEEGGEVTVPGQSGKIVCPPRTEICRPPPCINNCYGFGYCEAGQCVCDDGSDSCNFEYAAGIMLRFCRSFLLWYVAV